MTKYLAGFLSAVLLVGCAGGGLDVTSGGATSEEFASDALVQMVEYETFRNMMIEGLGLQTTGAAIRLIDQPTNVGILGGSTGNGVARNLAASPARISLTFKFANLACAEGIKNHEDELFPDGFEGDTLSKRLRGRALSASERAAVTAITQKTGFQSKRQYEQAICLFVVAGIRTSLK